LFDARTGGWEDLMPRRRIRTFTKPVFVALLALVCRDCVSSDDCSGPDTTAAGGAAFAELCSNIPRAVPSLSGGERTTFVSDVQSFGFDLYRALAADPAFAGQNLLVSPLSVSTALAMTAAGAKGATQLEMRQALRFTLPEPTIDEGFNWLKSELMQRPTEALATLNAEQLAQSSMELDWANAMFVQEGERPQPAFLDTLSAQYGACVWLLDFAHDPQGSRQAINDWVAAETAQRIQDLLPSKGVGTPLVVLVQAMSLAAPWKLPFEQGATFAAPFTTLDGSTVSVDMMHRSAYLSYLANADLEAAALPLLGGQLEVVIVMPREGKFASVEATLDGAGFSALRAALASSKLDVSLPKFRFTSDTITLLPALEALGMKLAFGDGADFSGVLQSAPMHITFVFHKAMVAFDEEGIEAAAATAVGMGGSGAFDYPDFTVDHPFFVGIRDRTTGALLFWGRILSPP